MKERRRLLLDLAILYPRNQLALYTIEQLPLTIGRSIEADVCIPDSTVSRLHCRIELRSSELWMIDLNSRNGMRSNNQQLVEARIELKQEFQLGNSTVVVLNFQLHSSLNHTIESSLARGWWG